MNTKVLATIMTVAAAWTAPSPAEAKLNNRPEWKNDAALKVGGARVTHESELGLLYFQIRTQGNAGSTVPEPAGQLDGAPVLAYVFPTTLPPSAAGFGNVEGILALAATSHPDFDDTPLWDENADSDYGNDGRVYHSHWVVLQTDDRVPGGFSVIQFDPGDDVTLPTTNPGMPIYLDSPGFNVHLKDDVLTVTVPANRIGNAVDFNHDALTCYLQVNGSDDKRPMLGVYEVYDILSENLTLPNKVEQR